MYSVSLLLLVLSSLILSAAIIVAPPHIGPVAAQEEQECPAGTFWNGEECNVRTQQPRTEEKVDQEELPSVPFPE